MDNDEDDKDHQQQQQSVVTLLTELIVEILLRLPVDSLLRCKSVCKSWRSLISDPHFINSHLKSCKSVTNNHYIAHHRLISTTSFRRRIMNIKSCNLYDVMYANSVTDLRFDSPLKHPSKSVKIVGSCNGLVCIFVEEDGLFIWNPSTRKSNRLPRNAHTGRSYWRRHYGFGYEESSDDYKVVEMCAQDETSVMIYSLRNGNWKRIGDFTHGRPMYYSASFSNGALHWFTNRDIGCDNSASDSDGVVQLSFDLTIISLNLATETYEEVSQPIYDEVYDFEDLSLGSLREQLCVLSDYDGVRADVWVMKQYGVGNSWTKLVSIPYLTGLENECFSIPLCISNDGKVLLHSGWNLFVYDSKNNSFSEIQKLGKCFQFSTFVESLVSPMPAEGLGDRTEQKMVNSASLLL